MGSWDFTQLGVSTTKENKKLLRQLLECVGVNIEDGVYESQAGVINPSFDYSVGGDFYGELYDRWSDYEAPFYPYDVFCIANILFPGTYIYFEHEDGSSVTDWYVRVEDIYDPVKGKCFSGEYDYSYGFGYVNGEPPYPLIKDECEELAKERGIKIKWDKNGKKPENDEFFELCNEILHDRHSFKDLSTEISERPVDYNGYDKKEMKQKIGVVLDNATDYGYTELTALILEKFKDILGTDLDNLSLDDN